MHNRPPKPSRSSFASRQNATTKIAFQLFPPPPWSPFWNWKFSSRSYPTLPQFTLTLPRAQCAQWRHRASGSVRSECIGAAVSDFPFPIRVPIEVQYLRYGGVFPTFVVCSRRRHLCWRLLVALFESWKIPPSNGLEKWFSGWWREKRRICVVGPRGEDKLWWSNRT